MSISPSEVVLTSSMPAITTFQCTIQASIRVTTIYNMQILSKGETGKSSVVLAEVANSSPTSPTLTDDAPQGSSICGGIDPNTPTSSTLTLTRPTADVLCSDKGYYECALLYQDANSYVNTLKNNQTLSIYVVGNNRTATIPTVAGNTETATIPTVTQTCSGCPLGLAVGIIIGTLLFIEGVVGAVIYYIINRRKSLTNNSTAGPNVYEIPNRRAFETEHVYNQ